MTTPSAEFDPVAHFPEFYSNPVIQELAHEPRWTVSDNTKTPIDMRELLDNEAIRGAWSRDQNCLVALDELTTRLPNAANAAFYLQAQIDEYAVLDIEPSCPPHILKSLLAVESIYSELSMSGKGYHLLLPLPKNFEDFPIAKNKKVLRHHTGWFEILLEHWVTFTRNPLPAEKAVLVGTDPHAWEKLYAMLAAVAKEAPTAEVDIDIDKPEIPYEEKVLEMIVGRARIKKTITDFNGDYSRYEFSVMGSIYNAMGAITWAFEDENTHFTDTHKAWLVFLAAQKILDARNKHTEMRNGMPLLLNNSVSMIAQRKGQEHDQG